VFGSAKSEDNLPAKDNELMRESCDLSIVHRKSDQKRAEAEEIDRQLDELDKRA
jgi:hypothetical protein